MKIKIQHFIAIFVVSTNAICGIPSQAEDVSNKVSSNGKSLPKPAGPQMELQQDLKILASFNSGEKRNFTALRAFIEEAMQKRQNEKSLTDLQFTVSVCSSLSSWSFSTPEEAAEAQRMVIDYSTKALKENKDLPINLKVSFFIFLLPQHLTDLKAGKEDLSNTRRLVANQWIDLIRLVESEIDYSFDRNDPKNLAVLNVDPPEGARLGIFGAGPETIKDPVLRRQYEEDIEKNRIKAQKYQQQTRIRQTERRAIEAARIYLVKAYNQKPEELDELNSQLATIKDSTFKQSVLNGIQNTGKLENLLKQERTAEVHRKLEDAERPDTSQSP